MSKFSETLRRIRFEKHMTQEEFASLLGTSKQNISRYESGIVSPKITTAAVIAQKLGISLSELNGSDDYPAMRSVGVTADTQPRRRLVARVRRYDDHSVQVNGTLLAPPEYQARKYREAMRAKRIKDTMDPITEEELELIKLFRSTDAKGQETIKNIAQMVNERIIEKKEKKDQKEE